MAFWDRWLDSKLQGLGYIRADQQSDHPQALLDGETSGLSGLLAGMSDSQLERLAMQSSWVYSDIDLLAKEASRAHLTMNIISGEGTEEVKNHPFEQLLRRPNPFMGRSFLFRYTYTWLHLRGEAYWWLVPNMMGEIAEIWPIPANRIKPVPHATEYISHYLYYPKAIGRDPVKIPADQICFFRMPNPFDFYRGLSPLAAAERALKTDVGAQQWNQETFTAGVPFRVIMSARETMSTTQMNVLRADIRDEFEQRKRILVVRGGDLNAKELGLAQQEMEFLAGREFTREEIDRMFGIPAGFWAKEATRANSEAARASLVEFTVYPLLVLMCEQADAQIVIPRYGQPYTLIPEDIRVRDGEAMLRERESKRAVSTFNGARQDAGLQVYEGPYAALLGDLPYPLATDPTFVTAYLGLGGMAVFDGEGLRAAQRPPGSPVVIKAAGDDLKRWRGIALRMVRRGENPGEYEFESEFIPADVLADVRDVLRVATTEDDVAAAFDLRPMPAAEKARRAAGHEPISVLTQCPLCGEYGADRYEDHGGLQVCHHCRMTYDPVVEVYGA